MPSLMASGLAVSEGEGARAAGGASGGGAEAEGPPLAAGGSSGGGRFSPAAGVA